MEAWLEHPILQRADFRAVLIVAGAYLGALLADWIVCSILRRLAGRSKTDFDDRLIDCLHRPIQATVFLWGLHMAIQTFDPPPVMEVWLDGFVLTALILFWIIGGFRLIGVFDRGLSSVAENKRWIDSRMLPLFENLARVVLVAVGGYAFLRVWHLDVTPWLGGAGIAGIAVGFAAKDTLANIFGGLSIIIDAPYKVGDFINLDTGERGMVTKIGLRSTRILTRADIEVTVPNAQIANSTVVNESGGRWIKSRVSVRVGVAYGADVDQVRRILVEAAKTVESVLDDPEPVVRFREFGDSALLFDLLVWISEPVLRGRTQDALNAEIYRRLNEARIKIPFPQRELTLDPSVRDMLGR